MECDHTPYSTFHQSVEILLNNSCLLHCTEQTRLYQSVFSVCPSVYVFSQCRSTLKWQRRTTSVESLERWASQPTAARAKVMTVSISGHTPSLQLGVPVCQALVAYSREQYDEVCMHMFSKCCRCCMHIGNICCRRRHANGTVLYTRYSLITVC